MSERKVFLNLILKNKSSAIAMTVETRSFEIETDEFWCANLNQSNTATHFDIVTYLVELLK